MLSKGVKGVKLIKINQWNPNMLLLKPNPNKLIEMKVLVKIQNIKITSSNKRPTGQDGANHVAL